MYKKILLLIIMLLPFTVLADDKLKFENLKLKEDIRKIEKNYTTIINDLNNQINSLNQKIIKQNKQIDFLGKTINENNDKYVNEIKRLNILLEEKKNAKIEPDETIKKNEDSYKIIIPILIIFLVILIIFVWKKMSYQNKFYFCRKANK